MNLYASETQIQKSIMQYLQLMNYTYFRINTKGEFMRKENGDYVLKKNINRGFSDILCIYQGKPIFLEVKSKTGKLTPHQKEFGKRVVGSGGYFFVVRSVDDVKEIFKSLI